MNRYTPLKSELAAYGNPQETVWLAQTLKQISDAKQQIGTVEIFFQHTVRVICETNNAKRQTELGIYADNIIGWLWRAIEEAEFNPFLGSDGTRWWWTTANGEYDKRVNPARREAHRKKVECAMRLEKWLFPFRYAKGPKTALSKAHLNILRTIAEQFYGTDDDTEAKCLFDFLRTCYLTGHDQDCDEVLTALRTARGPRDAERDIRFAIDAMDTRIGETSEIALLLMHRRAKNLERCRQRREVRLSSTTYPLSRAAFDLVELTAEQISSSDTAIRDLCEMLGSPVENVCHTLEPVGKRTISLAYVSVNEVVVSFTKIQQSYDMDEPYREFDKAFCIVGEWRRKHPDAPRVRFQLKVKAGGARVQELASPPTRTR